MPLARQRARSPESACAVNATIGSPAPEGVARMARVAANPSISGIWMSMRTRSYGAPATASTAARPSPTTSTWWPRLRSIVAATS